MASRQNHEYNDLWLGHSNRDIPQRWSDRTVTNGADCFNTRMQTDAGFAQQSCKWMATAYCGGHLWREHDAVPISPVFYDPVLQCLWQETLIDSRNAHKRKAYCT
jgi:hypothetical protein